MHELAVTESILEIALRHAQASGASRITDLHIVVGQLSSLVDDSVQFYWDIISNQTLAEGAQLHFKRIPAELLCLECNLRYQPGPDNQTGDFNFACPTCDSIKVKIVAGEEFQLESMEVEI